MHYPPENDDDLNYLYGELKAELWMVKLLHMNSGYKGWAPFLDYMAVRGTGWNSPIVYEGWENFDFFLDDLNVIVNFYFEIDEESNKQPTVDSGEAKPKVNLILWALHPRKGASRGIEVRDIKKGQIPEIIDYLNEASRRNQEIFSKLDKSKFP